jgi:hypothetical protein
MMALPPPLLLLPPLAVLLPAAQMELSMLAPVCEPPLPLPSRKALVVSMLSPGKPSRPCNSRVLLVRVVCPSS